MTNSPGFLERLGIHGCGSIEPSLLAGLALGDPVLLQGQAGSAKTLLVTRVAAELGLAHWAYDCSKICFEDILGFPNPADLSQGRVSYVQTPLSLFDKECVLFDEISRAAPSVQSKLLDVIRARSIMGIALPKLKYVFAAMNPPGDYSGAHPLDRALAGRFAFILPMPAARDMDPDALVRIITQRAAEDARLLGGGEPAARVSLGVFLERVRARLPKILEEQALPLQNYVLNVLSSFWVSDVDLDGRRAGMIFRNLAAALAVFEELGEVIPPLRLGAALWPIFRHSLPFDVTGESVSDVVAASAHAAGVQAFLQGRTRGSVDASLRLLSTRDLVRAATIYREAAPTLNAGDHESFITRLLSTLEDREAAPETLAGAYTGLRRVVGDYQSGRIRAGGDLMARAMGGLRGIWDHHDLLKSGLGAALAAVLVKHPRDAAAAHIALRRTSKESGTTGGRNFRIGPAYIGPKPSLPAEFDGVFQALRKELSRFDEVSPMEKAI